MGHTALVELAQHAPQNRNGIAMMKLPVQLQAAPGANHPMQPAVTAIHHLTHARHVLLPSCGLVMIQHPVQAQAANGTPNTGQATANKNAHPLISGLAKTNLRAQGHKANGKTVIVNKNAHLQI